MPSTVGVKPAGVVRVVYKEIVEGDFRKFIAKSNDSKTGGGARDLRFRPHSKFKDVFRELFPVSRSASRRRNGVKTMISVFVGKFYWLAPDGSPMSGEARYESPTTARLGEGRIPVVYKYPPFNALPRTDEGRMVVLLVQRDDGTVWPEFATEKSLRSGGWDNSVSDPILRTLDAKRKANQVARGYIDFANNTEYSDAIE